MRIDYQGLDRILEHVRGGNVNFLVLMGTTGECPTLCEREQMDILDHVTRDWNSSLPLVLGVGGNHTEALCRRLRSIRSLAVDYILSVVPYYNRPSQQGLLDHFRKVADDSPFPVVLYNVPSRTASNLLPETVSELSRHQNIAGIKEASGDLGQCREIIASCLEEFVLLCGEDDLVRETIALGGIGSVSVAANFIPLDYSSMVQAALDKNKGEEDRLWKKIGPTLSLLKREGNPTSVKTALQAAGLCNKRVRLPLSEGSTGLEDSFAEQIPLFFLSEPGNHTRAGSSLKNSPGQDG